MSIYINKDNYIPTEETVLDEIYTELQQLRGNVDSLLKDREEKELPLLAPITYATNDWIYSTLKMLQVTIAYKKSAFNISESDMFIEQFIDPETYVLQVFINNYTCAINVKEQIKTIKDNIVAKELKNLIFIDIFLPSFYTRV